MRFGSSFFPSSLYFFLFFFWPVNVQVPVPFVRKVILFSIMLHWFMGLSSPKATQKAQSQKTLQRTPPAKGPEVTCMLGKTNSSSPVLRLPLTPQIYVAQGPVRWWHILENSRMWRPPWFSSGQKINEAVRGQVCVLQSGDWLQESSLADLVSWRFQRV